MSLKEAISRCHAAIDKVRKDREEGWHSELICHRSGRGGFMLTVERREYRYLNGKKVYRDGRPEIKRDGW